MGIGSSKGWGLVVPAVVEDVERICGLFSTRTSASGEPRFVAKVRVCPFPRVLRMTMSEEVISGPWQFDGSKILVEGRSNPANKNTEDVTSGLHLQNFTPLRGIHP